MRIAKIIIDNFKRFDALEIRNIPESVRLIMLVGPNGSGKSSLFDAMKIYYLSNAGFGWQDNSNYYGRSSGGQHFHQHVRVEVFNDTYSIRKGAFYFRTAYRNDPEFNINQLGRIGSAVDDVGAFRMIQNDATVNKNYQRLVSNAFEDIFSRESPNTTIGNFREKVVGELRRSMGRLFPDVDINSLGNPLDSGTFRFDKGVSKSVDYMNLSGGEKAAFDLVLDVLVKRDEYGDAIYCFDEPEAHMNASVQARLLDQLLEIVPRDGQIWMATHSIGMMRKAWEIAEAEPGSVAFLDFGDRNFDERVVIEPTVPTRSFWQKALHVAVDDLAALVVPKRVVICEGSLSGSGNRNAEHDAKILSTIFESSQPDVLFVSAGSAGEVVSDRLGVASILQKLASGLNISRVIDRDDRSVEEVEALRRSGVSVLRRRNIESYLYDDEVLSALCESIGKAELSSTILEIKQQAVANSAARGNPTDDLKSAAGEIYVNAKRALQLVAVGNDQTAFARSTLAPLVRRGMETYAELEQDIFDIRPLAPGRSGT